VGATTERTPVQGNPGFAGETGDFGQLTEADVRGAGYVGERPTDGGHPGASCSYPYQLAQREPDAPLFEGAYGERLKKIVSRYPTAQGALLPVLALAQEIRGHLNADSMAQVGAALGVSPTYVRGVATFYTMYNKRPVGDYLIQVCTNVACNLCGADDVLEALLDAAGVEQGEATPDGVFTIMEAECLGACGFPTAVQVNERYFENVEPGDVPALLERLRAERQASGAGRTARGASSERTPDTDASTAVAEDPGRPGEVMAPEANPYAGLDRTPPAPARPPAADEPAGEGQG
jgi:NADH:ubiquinone oxidoreductase subunit E